MKVRILPSATDGSDRQYLTTFLINDLVAVDAGCVGFHAGPAEQARISNIVITHSHADHVCSLPEFAMNVLDYSGRNTIVWSHEAVLESLRTDMFNGRLWPNLLAVEMGDDPIVRLNTVEPREPFTIEGLRFTAIPVPHRVPTMAYIIEDAGSAIVISTDSGPTDELWDTAARLGPKLKVVFAGVAFPDESEDVARVYGHLTPRLLREQVRRLPPGVEVVAVHIKPAHLEAVVRQLGRLDFPRLSIGTSAVQYEC